jgi:hypothetical protein
MKQETGAFPFGLGHPLSFWEFGSVYLQRVGQVEKKQVLFCFGGVNAKVQEILDQALFTLCHSFWERDTFNTSTIKAVGAILIRLQSVTDNFIQCLSSPFQAIKQPFSRMMLSPTHTIFPLFPTIFKYFPDPHKYFPDPHKY